MNGNLVFFKNIWVKDFFFIWHIEKLRKNITDALYLTVWYLKLPIVLHLNCNTQNSMLTTFSQSCSNFLSDIKRNCKQEKKDKQTYVIRPPKNIFRWHIWNVYGYLNTVWSWWSSVACIMHIRLNDQNWILLAVDLLIYVQIEILLKCN